MTSRTRIIFVPTLVALLAAPGSAAAISDNDPDVVIASPRKSVTDFDIAYADDGTLVLVFVDLAANNVDDELVVKTSSDNGSTWTELKRISWAAAKFRNVSVDVADGFSASPWNNYIHFSVHYADTRVPNDFILIFSGPLRSAWPARETIPPQRNGDWWYSTNDVWNCTQPNPPPRDLDLVVASQDTTRKDYSVVVIYESIRCTGQAREIHLDELRVDPSNNLLSFRGGGELAGDRGSVVRTGTAQFSSPDLATEPRNHRVLFTFGSSSGEIITGSYSVEGLGGRPTLGQTIPPPSGSQLSSPRIGSDPDSPGHVYLTALGGLGSNNGRALFVFNGGDVSALAGLGQIQTDSFSPGELTFREGFVEISSLAPPDQSGPPAAMVTSYAHGSNVFNTIRVSDQSAGNPVTIRSHRQRAESAIAFSGVGAAVTIDR